MTYEIVNLESKVVVGKSVVTTNENGQAMQDIGAMWQECMANNYFDGIKNKVDNKAIGLYTDYEGDATAPYRFMCCTEVADTATGELETRVIPAGKYAKFTVKGHVVNAVAKAWGDIWQMELDRSFTYDFEYYHHDGQGMDHHTIDIYIAIN